MSRSSCSSKTILSTRADRGLEHTASDHASLHHSFSRLLAILQREHEVVRGSFVHALWHGNLDPALQPDTLQMITPEKYRAGWQTATSTSSERAPPWIHMSHTRGGPALFPRCFGVLSVAGFCAPGPARRRPAAPAPGRPTRGHHSATGPVEGNRSKVKKTRWASAGDSAQAVLRLRVLAAKPPQQAHGCQVVPPPGDARCRMQDAAYITPCCWTGMAGGAPRWWSCS